MLRIRNTAHLYAILILFVTSKNFTKLSHVLEIEINFMLLIFIYLPEPLPTLCRTGT